MKLATRLRFTGGVMAVVALLVAALVASTSRQVERGLAEERAAKQVHDTVVALRTLTFEYAMSHQQRTHAQWQSLHASLAKLLAGGALFAADDQQVAIADLRAAATRLQTLFDTFVATRRAAGAADDPAALHELETRLVGQIMARAEGMLADSRALYEDSEAAMLAAQRRSIIAVAALGAGTALLIALTLVAMYRSVIRPLALLRDGMAVVGGGDLAFRLATKRSDEFGEVAAAFDAMTTELSGTTVSRDELQRANAVLQAEARVRQAAQRRTQAQLARLQLLHRISRAIGARQDRRSIDVVVLRTLEEQLPLDFCCFCMHDGARRALVVTSVGPRSAALDLGPAIGEHAVLAVDAAGLARCLRGQLVHERDLGALAHPFARRLARAGLNSLVLAPLLVENEVFGVLVAARREPRAFDSGDCEFLLQLSEHVALASQQARLFAALQRTYDDLRRTQDAVLQQERLRVLGQMASGIAHDINNAISPVMLYSESLLETEPQLGERARRCLATIRQAADDVATTVARLREFYRPRDAESRHAAVQLNALLPQVLELSRARWLDMPQRRGVVIDARAEPAADLPLVMGAEGELREALMNLVFNAVDAMPDGGTLTLRTRLAAEEAAAGGDGGVPPLRAVVEVVDTGVGMDERMRRRCLEPFYTTKGERGSGLGLPMVYGIARRHGAELSIDSQPGRGTTVRLVFRVPAVIVEPALDEPVAAPVAPLRILLVDDEPAILQSLQDALRADGHDVSAALGGQAGIDAFGVAQAGGAPFAVVITDLGMPHVDGRLVAAAVKQASASTPVFLLTGWGRQLDGDGDIPAHVDELLAKPPKLRELRAALARRCCARDGVAQA